MAGKDLGQRKQPRTFGEWLDQTIESCEERIERGELIKRIAKGLSDEHKGQITIECDDGDAQWPKR